MKSRKETREGEEKGRGGLHVYGFGVLDTCLLGSARQGRRQVRQENGGFVSTSLGAYMHCEEIRRRRCGKSSPNWCW
jgi:hypothetical protein